MPHLAVFWLPIKSPIFVIIVKCYQLKLFRVLGILLRGWKSHTPILDLNAQAGVGCFAPLTIFSHLITIGLAIVTFQRAVLKSCSQKIWSWANHGVSSILLNKDSDHSSTDSCAESNFNPFELPSFPPCTIVPLWITILNFLKYDPLQSLAWV